MYFMYVDTEKMYSAALDMHRRTQLATCNSKIVFRDRFSRLNDVLNF